MTKIYFLNTIKDVQAFAKAFPDSRWVSGRPLDLTRDFKAVKLPVALYQFTDNSIAWDYIRKAREDLTNAPYMYVLTTIPKCLTLVEIFYAFLKHHNTYDKYIHDVAHHSFNHKPIITTSKLLSSAINWHASDRFNYWGSLHNKWHKLVNELQLPNDLIPPEFFEQLSLMEKLHD